MFLIIKESSHTLRKNLQEDFANFKTNYFSNIGYCAVINKTIVQEYCIMFVNFLLYICVYFCLMA